METFKLIYILILFINFAIKCNSFYDKDSSIKIKEPFYDDPTYFNETIKSKYMHYTSLHDASNEEGFYINNNKDNESNNPNNYLYLCNLESKLENSYQPIDKILELEQKTNNCIPNSNTFTYLLDENKVNEASSLIKMYLENGIDPSSEINKATKKKENLHKQINDIINPVKASDINPKYSFYNYDNYIKFIVKLDKSYQADNLTVICFEDMFIIRGIFSYNKNTKFKLNDRKKFYDYVEDDCDYNYNSFQNEIEISFIKKYKLKKWSTLFVDI